MKKLCIKIIIIIILFFGSIIFLTWQNNAIVVTEFKYHNEMLPLSFNGYTILQISDLHNKEFGKNQTKILDKIKNINPDIIVITGDLIDSSHPNIDVAMAFVNGVVDIAPIYYVSGNHENWSGQYDSLEENLIDSGVVILANEKETIFKDGFDISILGVVDPTFFGDNHLNSNMANILESLTTDNKFEILLAHRPELFNGYYNSSVDLVLAGHAHGGQIRFPFIGGLIAPDQGLFPKLVDGVHTENGTTMIISRGLGNSIIPFRIFNRPELVVVTLLQ